MAKTSKTTGTVSRSKKPSSKNAKPRNAQNSTTTSTATAVAEPKSKAVKSNCPAPTHEQIRQRAYEIYMARKGGIGDPEQDWLQAERELRAE